jgi:hypothetical protein
MDGWTGTIFFRKKFYQYFLFIFIEITIMSQQSESPDSTEPILDELDLAYLAPQHYYYNTPSLEYYEDSYYNTPTLEYPTYDDSYDLPTLEYFTYDDS